MKPYPGRILCTLALAGTALAQTAGWNIRDHIPLERVVIQGHRGVGNLAEENTMSFATDHPDVALREIRAYYTAKGRAVR